jgi:hypothetical protein
MPNILTHVEYLLTGGQRGKRLVRRDDTTNIDSFSFFSPELEEILTDIKEVLPLARGTATAAQSISVNNATDRPFDTRDVAFFGESGSSSLVLTNTLGPSLFIDVSRMKRFRIQFNNGSTALNSFEISAKCQSNSDACILYSTSAHYSSLNPNGIVTNINDALSGTFVNPFTLAGTGKMSIAFDFTKYFVSELRFRATVASGSSSISYNWGGV